MKQLKLPIHGITPKVKKEKPVMLTTKVELITPKKAEEYLGKNVSNRVVRSSVVEKFMKIIKEGNFHTTHQGIAFDVDGNLSDGQHRLMAIVAGGISVNMQVTHGLARDAFSSIDIGEKRTVADALFRGEKMGSKITEVCTCALRLTRHKQITQFEVMKVLEKHQDTITELIEWCSTPKRTLSSSPIRLACCYWMDAAKNRTAIKNMYWDLVNLNFDALPPIAKSFLKQSIESPSRVLRGGDVTLDLFCRAMMMFDPDKANNKLIKIPNPVIYVNMLKDWIDL